jgi:hypothetical protein
MLQVTPGNGVLHLSTKTPKSAILNSSNKYVDGIRMHSSYNNKK